MTIPKITVLVPMYNVEKYVSKCLESLINQTFSDFEVWAVSDGSPDNSAEIVRQYCKKDSRIKLIEKSNGGYGSVLQYGVDNIESKYFIICDPDDWLSKDALEKLYTFAERNNLDLTIGDKYTVCDGEITYAKTFENFRKVKARKVYTSSEMIQYFSFGTVSPHAKLFKLDITRGIKFPTHVSYTDFVLYTLSLANSHRVAYIDDALAFYLIERPGNTRTDVRPKIISNYLTGCKSTIVQLENYGIERYPVLLFRIIDQILFIMREYKRVTDTSFRDRQWQTIIAILNYLGMYRRFLLNNSCLNTEDKIKVRLLLNKKYNRLISKWLVKYKY